MIRSSFVARLHLRVLRRLLPEISGAFGPEYAVPFLGVEILNGPPTLHPRARYSPSRSSVCLQPSGAPRVASDSNEYVCCTVTFVLPSSPANHTVVHT